MTAVTTIAGGRGPYEQTHSIIASSATPVSGPADTSENILATVTIPAGVMGTNGRLRIESLWTITNSANNKIVRVRLGGISGTQFLGRVIGAAATFYNLFTISNRNAANSQVSNQSNGDFTISTASVVTGSIDTSTAQSLVFTGQKASAGETITLESYLVELIRVD